MKTPTRLALLAALACPLAPASGEGVEVLVWEYTRGGIQLNPPFSPSLRDAIEAGLDDDDVVWLKVNTLTPQALAGVDYAFLWTAATGDEKITPLTQDEQDALRAWVDGGGALFIAEEFEEGDDPLLGAPFGLHVVGTDPANSEAEVTDAANPITDGPHGSFGFLPYMAMGLIDEAAVLPGFEPLAWVPGGMNTLLGWYDRGALAPGSGPVCFVADSTHLSTGAWDERYETTLSNFYAFAAADAGCNAADLAEPFGVLDLADVQIFIVAFQNQDAIADLAAPFGVWDLADVQAFIAAFNAGCP